MPKTKQTIKTKVSTSVNLNIGLKDLARDLDINVSKAAEKGLLDYMHKYRAIMSPKDQKRFDKIAGSI